MPPPNTRRRRRRRRQPRKDNPLELRFEGVDSFSTPSQIRRRVGVIQKLLHNAVADGTKSYGLKLRKSAKIRLIFDAAEQGSRHVATRREPTTYEIDGRIIVSMNFSKEEAWQETARRTKKILNAIAAYADFADSIRRINNRLNDGDERALAQLPENHPDVYFNRFVRPAYGRWYKDTHKRLLSVREARERQAAIRSSAEAAEAADQSVTATFDEINKTLEADKKVDKPE